MISRELFIASSFIVWSHPFQLLYNNTHQQNILRMSSYCTRQDCFTILNLTLKAFSSISIIFNI